jgi:hypothetical protein
MWSKSLERGPTIALCYTTISPMLITFEVIKTIAPEYIEAWSQAQGDRGYQRLCRECMIDGDSPNVKLKACQGCLDAPMKTFYCVSGSKPY